MWITQSMDECFAYHDVPRTDSHFAGGAASAMTLRQEGGEVYDRGERAAASGAQTTSVSSLP